LSPLGLVILWTSNLNSIAVKIQFAHHKAWQILNSSRTMEKCTIKLQQNVRHSEITQIKTQRK